MDAPYRSGVGTAPEEALEDAGIVGEVVRQFADPLALYRELVQNAIDAGSPAVHVILEHDPDEGEARIQVRDDGEGMDRAVIEDHLLVLFRSTKEGRAGKIGKFGIGFSSVLAIGPRLVVVRTARGGRRYELHLHPDHRYELFDAGGAKATGTTVTLHVPMVREAFDGFVASSRDALARWCRHASTPIRFRATAPDRDEPLADERIDTPLALDALVVTSGQTDGGALRAVVGLPRDGKPYAGFFNHGLTLHETDEPLLGRPIAFKVQDSRLGHTLSRDNVRRDEAFARALAFVGQLADGALADATGLALREEASREGVRAGYRELAPIAVAAGLRLYPDRLFFPLAEPAFGERAVDAATLARGEAVLATRKRSALVSALARGDWSVVDLAGGRAFGDWLTSLVETQVGRPVLLAEETLTLVAPVEQTPADGALLDRVAALLDEVHRRPPDIELAELCGVHEDALCLAGERSDPWLIGRDEAGPAAAFKRLRRRPLVLGVRHPIVVAARGRAERDRDVAAAHLARAILLAAGALTEERSERLAAASLAPLVGGGR